MYPFTSLSLIAPYPSCNFTVATTFRPVIPSVSAVSLLPAPLAMVSNRHERKGLVTAIPRNDHVVGQQ